MFSLTKNELEGTYSFLLKSLMKLLYVVAIVESLNYCFVVNERGVEQFIRITLN